MDLAFEDMDKRVDSFLKKVWDSTLSILKPMMASTVVARNLKCCLDQLKEHIGAGTP